MKKVTPKAAAKELLRREQAAKDLLTFTEYTHPDWNTGNHHRLICYWLQQVEQGKVKRLAIFAPPRHSKSELASRRFPAWYLGRHPDRQIICASAGGDLAGDIGADVRDMVKDPLYRNVFPETELRADSAAAGRWRTTKGGIYFAAGVGGQIVGRGAHLAVIDDPHKGRDEADSSRMRDVVSNWFFGDLITRLMNPEAILLMMTRWHEDDLAGRLLPPESEWECVDPNKRVFKAGDWIVVRLRAIEEVDGTDRALWPGSGSKHGYPIARLRSIRKSMLEGGRYREWNAQYQQNPISDEGTYIKREWFDDRWTDDTLPADLNIYMASDFAVTDKTASRDPDYTEHGVFGIAPDGRIYVLDWWAKQATPDVWIDRLLILINKWKPMAWFGEAGPIRRAIESILTRRSREKQVFCRKEWIASTKDKTIRGRSFQAWASSGRIVFPRNQEWSERLLNQCVAFPTARHDDGFDVMSLMCSVVDQAHPAVIRRTLPVAQMDSWGRGARRRAQAMGWKVV